MKWFHFILDGWQHLLGPVSCWGRVAVDKSREAGLRSRLLWIEGAPPIRLHYQQEEDPPMALGAWGLLMALMPPFIRSFFYAERITALNNT